VNRSPINPAPGQPGPVARALRSAAVAPIRLYSRFLSPWTPATCRFRPTCSGYAQEAIELHGIWRGIYLGLRRILRCHPFSDPGHDPVPQSSFARTIDGSTQLRVTLFSARSPSTSLAVDMSSAAEPSPHSTTP